MSGWGQAKARLEKPAAAGMDSATAGWSSGAASDTGRLRECNEDRWFIDERRGLYLVVDGVGGQAAGELAAETAVEAIRAEIGHKGRAETRVRRAITHANNRIWALARAQAELTGMACVLTLVLVEEGRITVGHVGDSRLYLIWRGAIRKLTSDHSPVGEGEDAGRLSEAEAMRHPRRNEIYREVGSCQRSPGDRDFIEIRHCRLRPDAALLLCSDGLTDHLTSAEVREIALSYTGDATGVARDLVAAANAKGGHDNLTALFIAGPEFRWGGTATRPRLSTTRRRVQARLFTGRMAFLTYGLLLGMLLWAALRIARIVL
jgi:serine/threonine protein phosphatase PrpC